MKFDFKTVVTLCTFAATIGGFYYSTQIRLDNLEEEVTVLQKQIKRIARLNKK